MSDESAVQINFARAIPLFPLEQVTLLPQQVIPLHVFEPRYRQMVDDTLDGAGLIAMAVFEGDEWKRDYHGRPAIRPAVCVGHIVRHEKMADGRYNLLLQGVCRATIKREEAPDEKRLYRAAMLEPVEDEGAELSLDPRLDTALDSARSRITAMLSVGPLAKLAAAEPILEYLRNDDIPSRAILELIAMALTSEARVRYRLLSEPDARVRADVLLAELTHLESLARKAAAQHPEAWPKGASWN
jgi:Lon protease-like protein